MQEAESLARHALHEAGGRLQPQRLVYRDGCPPVAGNIAVTPDRRLHVLVRPTDLKAAAHHRLDVWVREQRYRQRRPHFVGNEPWPTMLRPNFPRLSHPRLAQAIPSIACIAHVYLGGTRGFRPRSRR